MTPILEVKNLTVGFQSSDRKIAAARGVSFQLRPGEVLGMVGESGSGKTVTGLSCLRLIPEPPGKIEGGQILFEGKDLLRISKEELRSIRGNQISMVFQDPMSSLNPFLTVERQMTEVLETHRAMRRKEARHRCLEMLEQVRIPNPEKKIWSYPHELSGGQRQRVMLAMALLCEPKILIADEPTTALDVTIQAQILDLLRDFQKSKRMAVLLITHDLGIVAGLADRVLVMYAGKVVEEAPTKELFKNPKHPYTLGLLHSLPRMEQGKPWSAIPGQPPDPAELGPGCPFEPRCEFRIPQCRQAFPDAVPISAEHRSYCFEAEKL